MNVTPTMWFVRFLNVAQAPPPAPRIRGRASNVGEWMDVFLAAAEAGRPSRREERLVEASAASQSLDTETGAGAAAEPEGRSTQRTTRPAAQEPPLRYRRAGGSDE